MNYYKELLQTTNFFYFCYCHSSLTPTGPSDTASQEPGLTEVSA
ncbi:hypothetical protein FQN60_013379 [Etheostoma spectabile]|uniref:Uncharacterized protein n=1 Tax=Etheostoma spectabile TaxID=54343 RepID=A0A5J5D9C0_9PERO|nr:hypothetical protein FQN60_013379 [Etheostoma spectabile]